MLVGGLKKSSWLLYIYVTYMSVCHYNEAMCIITVSFSLQELVDFRQAVMEENEELKSKLSRLKERKKELENKASSLERDNMNLENLTRSLENKVHENNGNTWL